ncbi:MAG: hypothetical protein JOZ66_11600 [Hyphomicrobiales bacterium]|nr:hypothetical protein [Hyphomicrobiales bacterium]
MEHLSLISEEEDGLRRRLTDPVRIAKAVKLLREAGYTELAIWRHFIDAFAVDLDALSHIMKELFGKTRADRGERQTTTVPSPSRPMKAAPRQAA